MPYQNEDVVESKERMQLIIDSGVWREIVGGTINERRPRSQQIRSDACRAHQDRKDKSKPGPVASPACYTRRDRAGGSRRSRRWCRRPREHSWIFQESSRSWRKRGAKGMKRRRGEGDSPTLGWVGSRRRVEAGDSRSLGHFDSYL